MLMTISGLLYADDPGIPPDLQLSLFCKALTFDRTLEERCGPEVVMGILYQERYHASMEAKDELLIAAAVTKISHIRQMPFHLVNINIDDPAWQHTLETKGVDILFLMPVRSIDIKHITAFTRDNRLLTLTANPDLVEDGVSLGLRLLDHRPKFVINLAASRSEGADFSSQLLGLAEVIE